MPVDDESTTSGLQAHVRFVIPDSSPVFSTNVSAAVSIKGLNADCIYFKDLDVKTRLKDDSHPKILVCKEFRYILV